MHLPAILGAWGTPPDMPAWWALDAAAIVLVGGLFAARDPHRGQRPGRALPAVFAFGAALLSLGYVAFYLRGGPRIVDATSYFLQARALSEGHFVWHVPEPSASFRGRFLLAHDDAVAGIFPPGYPLLLSLGFAVGAPLVIGPLLAAAIVGATWALAIELAKEAGLGPRERATVAGAAACLSLVCAALRYHTADTMAHGACALAFTLALLAALRGRRDRLPWFFLLAGLPLGFVVATRFASALALGAILGWLALGSRKKAKAVCACTLGAVPGVLLLLVAQSAATGHPFGLTQAAYYATSDGPPDCFRYGFGRGIGCLVEHGDFVRARASDGYGLVSALGVTLRRLRAHSEDVASFEPLALLILVPLARKEWRTLGARSCLALVGALVVAYAPFYFDGDYPGGGARFFADVLPIEHALIALAIARLARTEPDTFRGSVAVIAVSLVGFAFHAAHDHEQLRARDGGHPMFDREVLTEHALGLTPKDGSPARSALVFVDSDHGFALGHDPALAEANAEALARGDKPAGLVVARLRNDDHDRLLYEHLGHPMAWVYRFLPETPTTASQADALRHDAAFGELQPWSPRNGTNADTWTFEAESEWPPLAQRGDAWAEPIWVTDTCASPSGAGRALAIRASDGETKTRGEVVIALPVPRAGTWRVTPRLLVEGDGSGLELTLLREGEAPLAQWTAGDTRNPRGAAGKNACIDAPTRSFTVPPEKSENVGAELRLVLSRPMSPGGGPDDAARLLALDRISLVAGPR